MDPTATIQPAREQAGPPGGEALPAGRALVAEVSILLCGSGFCALVYQIVWLRMLREVFGASTPASAAVLAVFMGGLGLGGLVLGGRADRKRSPLGFYGDLEVGIALLAAVSPALIVGIRSLYIGSGGSFALGDVPGILLRLALAAVVLGVPTFLMGGTLPAAARAVERQGDRARRLSAWLYGANTLGAVAGAFVSTFAAIEFLGLRKTLWVAAMLNLLIGIAARAKARGLAAHEGQRAAAAPATDLVPEEPSRSPVWWVLVAAAAAGFAFLLMELVWYRMLAPILGGSSYTFGLILAVALAGIGLGGLAYGSGARRRRPGLLALAATCALEALFMVLPFAAGDQLALLTASLRGFGSIGFGHQVFAWGVTTALVVLPAAVVAGYQFPLLIAVLGSGRARVGRDVGLTYACNTAGAIAGSVCGGFGLIPLLSATGAWRLAVLVLLATAAVSLGLALLRGTALVRVAAPAALGGVALLLCLTDGPGALWRQSAIGAGRFPTSFGGANPLRSWTNLQRRSIAWEEDGVESNVALFADRKNGFAFLVNGKSDGSARMDAPTSVMSGLVGALLHPEPRRVMVIGLGTGQSAGWLAAIPSVERVDVVELEPTISRVAQACSTSSQDALNNPKVHLSIGDGREWFLTQPRTYDLVLSIPSNPYRAGVASLFTRDFYRATVDRLAEHGVFLQWIQGYEIDADGVRTAYATLSTVFPFVEGWQISDGDLMLVASQRQIVHDTDRIARRLTTEPYRGAMARTWGVAGLEGLYSGYLSAPAFATAVAESPGVAINTDDHPLLEFRFARNLGRRKLFDIRALRDLARRRGQNRPRLTGRGPDWELADELYELRLAFWGADSAARGEAGRRARQAARQAYAAGDLETVRRLWFSQPRRSDQPADLLMLAEALAAAGSDQTSSYLDEIRRRLPLEASLVEARWRRARGESGEAERLLLAAFEECRTYPWVPNGLMSRSLQMASELAVSSEDGRFGRELWDLLAEPFALRMFGDHRHRLRLRLALHLRSPELCVAAIEPIEPDVFWEGEFLRQRADCYRETNHPLAARAAAERARYVEQGPPSLTRGLEPTNAKPPVPRPD